MCPPATVSRSPSPPPITAKKATKAKKVKVSKEEAACVAAQEEHSMWMTPAIKAVMKRKWIGAHVSASGGPVNALWHAQTINANAFALFLKSQRKWENPPLQEAHIAEFKERLHLLEQQKEEKVYFPKGAILPHGSYLINLASPNEETWQKSFVAFLDDLKRCEVLGIDRYNFQYSLLHVEVSLLY